jgi:hypothetical protein
MKAKKSKAKRTSRRKTKPDASQTALAVVEKIIGGKLAGSATKTQ